MFQGKATSEESRKVIRAAIKNKIPFECDIINYRKDGSYTTVILKVIRFLIAGVMW